MKELPADSLAAIESFLETATGEFDQKNELLVVLQSLDVEIKKMPEFGTLVEVIESEKFETAKIKAQSFLDALKVEESEEQEEEEEEKSMEKAESKFVFHMQMKNAREDEDGRIIEGYASVFNIEDRDGEVMEEGAFDKGLATFMKNPIVLLGHNPNEPIGTVLDTRVDKTGLFVKVKIADGSEPADNAWKLINQGVLKAFSVGGMFQKVKNRIVEWDLLEISVVSVPANQRAVFSVAKAAELGTDIVETSIDDYLEKLEAQKDKLWLKDNQNFLIESIASLKELKYSGDSDAETKAQAIFERAMKEVKDKMPGDINEVVESVLTALAEKEKAQTEESEKQKIHDTEVAEKAIEEFKKTLKTKSPQIEFDVEDEESEDGDPDEGRKSKSTVTGKYDHMEVDELAWVWNFYKEAGIPHSRDLKGALVAKSKAHFATPMGRKDFPDGHNMGQKADELMHSTNSSNGDEWVPTLEAATLWPKVQLAAVVAPLFRTITMPSNPYDFPLDVSGPTIYTVPEAQDAGDIEADAATFTKSMVSTNKITFSAKKMGALAYFSEELIEDSIIPILPTLRADFIDGMARGLDRALISGDEAGATSTTNISFDGSAESATGWYAVTDGLRHEALITKLRS